MKKNLMSELEPLKMNLQYFAEDDSPNDSDDAGTDESSGENDGENSGEDSTVTLTEDELQEQIDSAVKARLARKDKELQEKLKEERKKLRADAERYAEMSEKEKKDAELEERIKELEEREQELNNRELLANIQTDLQERKLPLAFAETLLTLQDNEKIKQSIDDIEEVWNEEIAEAKKANVRQPNPEDSTQSYGSQGKKSKTDFFNEGRKI